ncbi:uncharacterized protein L3040_003114 [Drepanopeziza brunnea f. sp. 'multigermtubi']|uniref:Uncharacterized protein n=1 Tax=Marssonina brunnea f. sp. multigermtubi (strain MB_m1) TaxID=1072389 RepID=K1WTJ4_MARBU|nr:uncharacterized protein MBM_05768 [Drepanopeziza brunnea f. sp. 'multigermtubi' MB_m1]EKD15757.1 hypothetical protein MBM_05768 [Drepanopeziza brunnea f. sp. 'multigermtubi' MB_m1]KAJ5047281.1 hypothetical protein L3040_003114 [Drepanopeziza brunnea f. sp. 'multigermtubi']
MSSAADTTFSHTRTSSTASSVSSNGGWLELTPANIHRSDSVSSTSSGPFLSNATQAKPSSVPKPVACDEEQKRLMLLRARNN